MTLDEIGAMYGVTRERIRQIESKAMNQIRGGAYAERLRRMLGDLHVVSDGSGFELEAASSA